LGEGWGSWVGGGFGGRVRDLVPFRELAGQEFLIMLLILVPSVALVEDGGKSDDQKEGDEKDHRIKVSAMGLHVGPSVPAGRKIDDDRYNEQ
jgi:hypothetical protein